MYIYTHTVYIYILYILYIVHTYDMCVSMWFLYPFLFPRKQSRKAFVFSYQGFPMDSSRHAYRFRMEEERAAVRAVLHFGAKDDTSDDNAARLCVSHGESRAWPKQRVVKPRKTKHQKSQNDLASGDFRQNGYVSLYFHYESTEDVGDMEDDILNSSTLWWFHKHRWRSWGFSDEKPSKCLCVTWPDRRVKQCHVYNPMTGNGLNESHL